MSDIHGSGHAFRTAADVVLEYLRAHVPMGLWSITRVENDHQTHLILGDNAYNLTKGDAVPWSDTYCVHMVAGETPQVAGQAASVQQYRDAGVNDLMDIKAYFGAPIMDADGSLFGVICGLDPQAQEGQENLEQTLSTLSELMQVALAADRRVRSLEAQLAEAQHYASTDALTGIGNRHAWERWLTTLEEDFADLGDPTVIMMVDLDDFKSVNDGPGGHAAGDELLSRAAAAIAGLARPEDRVARIGGDEFGMIVHDCTAAQGPAMVDRIVGALAAQGVEASAGFAPLVVGENVDEAVRRADGAMFASKQAAQASRIDARA